MARILSVALFVVAATASVQLDTPVARPSLDEWKDSEAAVAEEAAAVTAKDAKMAAVGKVITMLESLRSKVMAEGESESKTYNEFACFCKDTTAEKTAAIDKGTDDKATLSADIETYASERDGMDTLIQTLLDDIAKAEKTMKEAEAARAATLATYQANEADLRAAIEALEGAITSLKASKSPSLLQLKNVQDTIRTATELADALGLANKATTAFLQQAPEVAMEDYKFHSNDIIETLENLMKSFRTEKADVDAAEVESIKLHDSLIQEQTDLKKAKELELGDTKQAREAKIEEIAMATSELTTVAATLLDDQQYLSELSTLCTNKARTWDQRSQVRQDELSALTAAIDIVKGAVTERTTAATVRLAQAGVTVRLAHAQAINPHVMEAIEAEAEAADASSMSFLQRLSSKKGFLAQTIQELHNIEATGFLAQTPQSADASRDKIAAMFKTKGAELKSTLLTALASQIAAVSGKDDPFAKVKFLIQELIERLLKEAGNESNQKDWCDKATADAEQKRDYAAKAVQEHNAAMAVLEAKRDKLNEQIGDLVQAINQTKMERAEAVAMRAEEKAENENTIEEANYGLEAISEAMDIIDKFYKTVAKSTVETSLVQGPADDAPDAGFKNFEAYTGGQGEATGVLGMMEVIKGDFTRTISETQKAEMEAEQDHLQYMTESGMSLAQKEAAAGERAKQLNDALEKLEGETEGLGDQMEILTTSIKELLELKPACVDTGMSYEERVARREDEIAALQRGLCILEAYLQYGPEGAADSC